ncbi:hypothetical protein DAPPUDRAFT_250266 [Daphnia pulex]|uniref:Uncharacterized protein n=1 Tax=Daphnia pulex TaxID=6669 RepID=E9GY77_DAPPU|nr:hypothetical protein DAPPUDRAFT_250266 [Daphnia pulex]|eukprot:EFX75554.1 hypothetical protein DAPPUDRAFT_250266 [Daphnia pulex]
MHGFSEELDVSSDPYDNYDLENELEMIYIDLGIEFDDVETGDEVSVSEILQTSITKGTDEGVREYDFNRRCQLKTPCSTSWNSEFDSVQFIMVQPEDKIQASL